MVSTGGLLSQSAGYCRAIGFVSLLLLSRSFTNQPANLSASFSQVFLKHCPQSRFASKHWLSEPAKNSDAKTIIAEYSKKHLSIEGEHNKSHSHIGFIVSVWCGPGSADFLCPLEAYDKGKK
jgi:hypothetical protein